MTTQQFMIYTSFLVYFYFYQQKTTPDTTSYWCAIGTPSTAKLHFHQALIQASEESTVFRRWLIHLIGSYFCLYTLVDS